ncbi:MAG: type-F conjugative transfer system secretin TraK [Holosporaceae bacterium]|jgi:hypothetical protein|nr:type-F conjugative transfer system secretin TraK [Holosporaceae bacterium]
MKKISVFFLLSFFISLANGETFRMKNEIIHAKISFQHLNRICVKNDRIASISGLEEAFHCEKNEKTGEGFIRATVANGHEPISISITTISGRTQDLLLEVVDGEPTVIELENPDAITSINSIADWDAPNIGGNYEESIVESMKQFILACPRLSKLECSEFQDRIHEHIRAEFQSAHHMGGFFGLVFKISTDQDGTFRLDEGMFSREKDVALSLTSLELQKNKFVILYVLRK